MQSEDLLYATVTEVFFVPKFWFPANKLCFKLLKKQFLIKQKLSLWSNKK